MFVVQREGGEGPRRTLHRNHLLPVSNLPIEGVPEKVLPEGAIRNKGTGLEEKVELGSELEGWSRETEAGRQLETGTESASEDELLLSFEVSDKGEDAETEVKVAGGSLSGNVSVEENGEQEGSGGPILVSEEERTLPAAGVPGSGGNVGDTSHVLDAGASSVVKGRRDSSTSVSSTSTDGLPSADQDFVRSVEEADSDQSVP